MLIQRPLSGELPNNPVGEDCRKVLVVLPRLLAAAQPERSCPSDKRRKFDDNSRGVLVNGDLTMTSPDLSKMTRQELRAYVLAHREDDAAIEALIKTGNPNSPTYPFPQTDEDLREMGEILKRKLG